MINRISGFGRAMPNLRKAMLGVSSVAISLSSFAANVQAEENSLALDEIIVTAQKRSQSLQDTSVAVAVVSAARLMEARIDNLEDLQAIVPNISFGSDFNVAKLFVRGVGTNTSTPGADSGVAMYVDGAVLSRPGAQFASMYDLERVEVLRGPQGSLFGRNSVGGAVNLITAKPTEELEGYGRFTIGDYSLLSSEGAVSGPLMDSVTARVAYRVINRGGYGINEHTTSQVDNLAKSMGRLHLNFDISEDVNLLVTGEYFTQNDRSAGLKFAGPNFPNGALPIGLGGFAEGQRNISSEMDPVNTQKTWAINATLDWDINDDFSVKNILNYREYANQLINDLDLSSVVNSYANTGNRTTIQNRNVSSESFSEELQLHYSTDRVKAVMGFFLFKENFRSFPNTIGLTPTGGQNGNLQRYRATRSIHEADALALFGQVSYVLTDTVNLKIGGRFSHERRYQDNAGIILGAAGSPGQFPINVETAEIDRERTFNDFTPELGFEWRPTDDIMAYYTYSEGFKSGTGQATITAAPIINPEIAKNHEAGIKTSWFDNQLVVNIAAFVNDLDGLQISKTKPQAGGAGFSVVFENATTTHGEGVEVEVNWQVTENFRLDGAAAYLKSTFGNFETKNPLNPSGGIIQIEGNSTRYSPKWSYNLHGTYEVPLDNDALVTISADISYKAQQYFTEFMDSRLGQGGYTLIDASVRYTSADEQWTATAWAKNLTDEFVVAGAFAISTSASIGRTLLPPRTFGLTVGYNF
ncbi:MAG: TonB-dependent receptor [Emcibacter sp.]|nr:TonB-dependent receptor [Emcibacter sp.]